MTAFEDLAELVHEQHRLASRVETWRECGLILCYRAKRLIEQDRREITAGLTRESGDRDEPHLHGRAGSPNRHEGLVLAGTRSSRPSRAR